LIGKTLAHYEVTGLLGSGGMGDVWRARDTRLGRDVALKVLPDAVTHDPERRARFEREARAIAAIDHPNVVTIYAVEEAEGHLLLSMEVVEGQTLGELIPPGGLPLDRILEVATPMASALAAAHGRGITHRDLKPANVMVRPDGQVRILDFGLAKLVDGSPEVEDATIAVDATAEGRVLGTTAYMSPEQAEGKPVDPRTDVFALGILLYQMATGEKPFVGDTPISTITSILRDEPRPMHELKPELPTQLGRIIGRCLQKDPENRYDTAKGLMFELENLQEDSSSSSMAAVSPPRSGTHRNRMLGAAAFVVLLAVIGFFSVRGMGNDPEPATAVEPPPPPGLTAAENGVPTIVIFPFENRGEPEDAYFAEGITDEIATRLVGTDGVAVLSRSSARNYDRTGKTILQIAEDLGVDYVLEGSVRWQGRTDAESLVRVSPVLVYAPEDRQVWADSYDRDMREIFAIQTEIASAVATQIGTALAPQQYGTDDAAPTQDMEAYHLFLRARQAIDRGQLQRPEWEIAETLLQNALERDPTYSAAWAYLARVQAAFCHFNWDRSERRLAAGRRAAARARELAPGTVEDHLAHGYVYYWGEKDFPAATREFEAALARQPGDVETIEALGFVARREGRFEDALRWLNRAQELSPSNWRLAFNMSETLHILRRYEEALLVADEAIRFDPGAPGGYVQRATSLANMGRLDEALDVIGDVPRFSTDADEEAVTLALAALDLDMARSVAARQPEYSAEQFGDVCAEVSRGYLAWIEDGREASRSHFERAVATLRPVVAAAPDQSNPAMLLAESLAALGEVDEAVDLARSALGRYPAGVDTWIRLCLEWDLARVLLLAGRIEEAETLTRQLCSQPAYNVSREFLRASPLYRSNGPIEPFARVADFEL